MPDDYHIFDKEQARKSIKSLMYEVTNLTPSSLMELFEIDMSTATKGIQSSLIDDGQQIGIDYSTGGFENADKTIPEKDTLRFHNNIKVSNSLIIWQGKTYYPAPIQAEGFDISSRGTLPTPILRITAQKEEGIQALSVLRRAIHKYGDIVGAKVTRIRTFAKYLDPANFSSISQIDGKQGIYESNFPDQYEPDPYAEFPRDIFYIERKSNENKINLEYELSALIDVEGIKLPRRVVLSKKCSFSYRGCGCFYEKKEVAGLDSKFLANAKTDPNAPGPGTTSKLLAKCDIRDTELSLPDDAPPVATLSDEDIKSKLGVGALKPAAKLQWSQGTSYEIGEYVFVVKNNIKYYFVAREKVPGYSESGDGNPSHQLRFAPPNARYWIADMCSKTLQGCRKRWGVEGGVVIDDETGTKDFKKGELQYGGFPNATRLDQTLR